LALFPPLIALVSIVGLVADPQATTQKVTQIGPSSAAQTFSGPTKSITSNQSAAAILFVAGLLGALWSASGYVGASMRASNVIYETPERRPVWKLRGHELAEGIPRAEREIQLEPRSEPKEQRTT